MNTLDIRIRRALMASDSHEVREIIARWKSGDPTAIAELRGVFGRNTAAVSKALWARNLLMRKNEKEAAEMALRFFLGKGDA